jgi:glycosyltransferase involved in cell wall biosynthesis
MPVFNERATLATAIERALAAELPVDLELIVVDDGSTDGSAELLREGEWPQAVTVVHHERNRGKGAAVRTALEHASGDLTAILDADLEYDPADIARLLEPLLEARARAVYGVRAFNGHTSHSFLFVLGNRFVTLLANSLFNVYIADLMTCHKAMRTDLFRSLDLREDGFTIEPEITARLLQQGERIYELPADYVARTDAEGKKLTWRDGLRVVRTLVRCRLAGGFGSRAGAAST